MARYISVVNMSESYTRNTETDVSWTDKQKAEFVAKFKEQKAVIDELSNLKKDRWVYRQQPNSNIYFLANRSKTVSECKKKLDDMTPTYQKISENIPAND